MLGQHYYLYLLPVDQHGGFDLSWLKIIADPHTVVLSPFSEWIVESNLLKCSMTADNRN